MASVWITLWAGYWLVIRTKDIFPVSTWHFFAPMTFVSTTSTRLPIKFGETVSRRQFESSKVIFLCSSPLFQLPDTVEGPSRGKETLSCQKPDSKQCWPQVCCQVSIRIRILVSYTYCISSLTTLHGKHSDLLRHIPRHQQILLDRCLAWPSRRTP